MPASESRKHTLKTWASSGDIWIWLNAAAVALSVIAVTGLLLVITVRGLAHFWPADVLRITVATGEQKTHFGELVRIEEIPAEQYRARLPAGETRSDQILIERWLIKTGNRKVDPPDFRWLFAHDVVATDQPAELVTFERAEWGMAYGFLLDIVEDGISIDHDNLWQELQRRLERVRSLEAALSILYRGNLEQPSQVGVRTSARALTDDIARDAAIIQISNGERVTLPLSQILRAWQPNTMTTMDKIRHYLESIRLFLSTNPREANTEGGIYPAIFGTVIMVLLMSIIVTPLGVVAAIYLHEYAQQGPLVRLVRIAVHNLAGVPSIVYGVFGLGFFVYFIGGNIDELFYSDRLPAPTFGTPGLLWASLTLALLTVPVVIVSTEEGLIRIPHSLRDGSLALGATKAETLFKVVLPVASPSILTGVILAVARAAGEVAPLMLVGVVKLAPTLPVDGEFPYLHLERKFMHLGFHIYDVGFQSANVEAARPLVYSTALLLVLIIVLLNLTAILIRSRLETRYRDLQT